MAVLYALLITITTIGYLASADTNEPDGCDGIGFGCSLPPDESFALVGVLVGVALLPVCVVVGAVIAVRARRSRAQAPE